MLRSAVLPPAPHVTVTNKGRRECDIRSKRARKFEEPIGVLGGKNSREKKGVPGGRAAILVVIFSMATDVDCGLNDRGVQRR
jgi:hypothetical protein